MNQHTVTLPHPSRIGPESIGGCSACAWRIRYGWGGHGDAAAQAGEHIREAGHAHPIELQTVDGTITMYEGLSL